MNSSLAYARQPSRVRCTRDDKREHPARGAMIVAAVVMMVMAMAADSNANAADMHADDGGVCRAGTGA